MAGYTRNDTSNNIATGNVINAADLDGEFDALVAAFHASTGHTHDGTAANGAPITKIGPVQDLVISTGAITPKTDNTVDLGSSSFEFKDLYIDGTANIDALVADTADINAGTIDGVVIGGSTTAAGSFTTLTTSSTVTLNGGTANGVLYLNGSKVATSGSALVFDGTNLGVGIASVAAAGTTIHVHGSTDSSLRLTNTTTGTGTSNGFKLQANGPDAYLVNYSNGFMAFYTNASEQMRLTSTGLGIGTSSPGYKLDVSNSGALGTVVDTARFYADSGSTAEARILFGTTANVVSAGIGAATTSATDGFLKFYTESSGTLAERMRLDSSGNLGLGVTPSAWNSGYKALQFFDVTSGSIASSGYASSFQTNAWINSSNQWVYGGGSYAPARYLQFDGTHYWYTAPSGTAGNAITFTQAMTLDAGGNLGVGSTTPSGTAGYRYVSILDGSTGSALSFRKSTNAEYGSLFATASDNSINLYATLVGPLIFGTSAVERARITSGGDLLVGTTSGSDKLVVEQSAAASASLFVNSSGTATAQCVNAWHKNTTGDNVFLQFFTEASATSRGSITYNRGGGVVAYNTTSDYRLKNVLGSIADSGARIDSLEPIEFEWKSNGLRTRGFLAHRFQEVYPNSVTGNKDAVDDKGEPIYQAMQASTSEIMADLVAEIQSLRQRVALLEGN